MRKSERRGVLLARRPAPPPERQATYLSFDGRQWAALRRAADRQGISVATLLEQFANRLADDLQDEP